MAKRGEICYLEVDVICIWGIFDLLVFKGIWGHSVHSFKKMGWNTFLVSNDVTLRMAIWNFNIILNEEA